MNARKSERVCVYDIVLKGEVVYVGITNKPEIRKSHHKASGRCPVGAEMVVHQWYSRREDAIAAEKSRQLELKPAFCRDIPKHDYMDPPKKPEFDWVEHRRAMNEAISNLSDEDIAEGARRYDEMMKEYRSMKRGFM